MSIPPSISVDVFLRAMQESDLRLAVDVLHDIIEDVIDSCALAVTSHLGRDGRGQGDLDIVAEDMILTVNDYAGNHYGVEDFGL